MGPSTQKGAKGGVPTQGLFDMGILRCDLASQDKSVLGLSSWSNLSSLGLLYIPELAPSQETPKGSPGL